MKDLVLGTMLSLRFQFSAPSTKLVKRGINLKVEDVLYNYIDATLMTTSQIGRFFKAVKEFHVITLKAFIDVYSPLASAFMDLIVGQVFAFILFLFFWIPNYFCTILCL